MLEDVQQRVEGKELFVLSPWRGAVGSTEVPPGRGGLRVVRWVPVAGKDVTALQARAVVRFDGPLCQVRCLREQWMSWCPTECSSARTTGPAPDYGEYNSVPVAVFTCATRNYHPSIL